jgi:hypothetical protein
MTDSTVPTDRQAPLYKLASHCTLALSYLNANRSYVKFDAVRSMQLISKTDSTPELEGAVGPTIGAHLKYLGITNAQIEPTFDLCTFVEDNEDNTTIELAVVDLHSPRIIRFLRDSKPSIELLLPWLAPNDEPRNDEELQQLAMVYSTMHALDVMVSAVSRDRQVHMGGRHPYEPSYD